MNVREITLSDHEPRVESGPVAFGDDWPGFFIRGDTCMGLWLQVHALKRIPTNGLDWDEKRALEAAINHFERLKGCIIGMEGGEE